MQAFFFTKKKNERETKKTKEKEERDYDAVGMRTVFGDV